MADTPEKSGCSPDGQISSSTNTSSSVESGTNSVKSSSKKYDLGVLFVHGIGRQKPGDTFNGIYHPIKNELESNASIKYQERQNPSCTVKGVEGDILDAGNVSKTIIFRESHWHESSDESSDKSSDKLSSCIALRAIELIRNSFNRIGGHFLVFCSIILWPIYFIGLRIFMELTCKRKFLPTVFIFVNIAIIYLSYVFKDSEKYQYVKSLPNTQEGRLNLFLLILVICGIVWALTQSWNRKVNLLNLRTVGLGFIFMVFIFVCIYTPGAFFYTLAAVLILYSLKGFRKNISRLGLIPDLWHQINNSADYVRTGDSFKYMEKVGKDIDELLQDSNRVIVVAHSMGEYLSYNYLKQKNSKSEVESIQLIGVGGGLGLVSLVGKLRASHVDGKIAPITSAVVSLYASIFAVVSAIVSIVVWWGFALDLSRFIPVIYGWKASDELLNNSLNNPVYLFETDSWCTNIIIHSSVLICLFGLRKFILQFIGIDKLNFNKFKFYRYSHPCDPVGNSVSFLYEGSVKQFITPNGWFAHGIETYFGKVDQKGNLAVANSEAEEYMRVRTVQHILHSLSIVDLPLVNMFWCKILVYGISTLVAPLLGLWIMSGFEMSAGFGILPMLFFIPNYFVSITLLWIISKGISVRTKSPGKFDWADWVFVILGSLILSSIITGACVFVIASM